MSSSSTQFDEGRSEEDMKRDSDKKSIFAQNPWNTFLGDCSVVDEYLLDKPSTSLKWAPLHYLNVFLRAVGQVRRQPTSFRFNS